MDRTSPFSLLEPTKPTKNIRRACPRGRGQRACACCGAPQPPKGGFIFSSPLARPTQAHFLLLLRSHQALARSIPPAPPTLAPPSGGLPQAPAPTPLRGVACGSWRPTAQRASPATCSPAGAVACGSPVPRARGVFRPARARALARRAAPSGRSLPGASRLRGACVGRASGAASAHPAGVARSRGCRDSDRPNAACPPQ